MRNCAPSLGKLVFCAARRVEFFTAYFLQMSLSTRGGRQGHLTKVPEPNLNVQPRTDRPGPAHACTADAQPGAACLLVIAQSKLATTVAANIQYNI
jgi:hypothetical protein